MPKNFLPAALASLLVLSISADSSSAKPLMFVFNSDGGAAAIAHIKGKPVREVVCHELNELEGTAVTDFFWCPIVGGNVFIYPTNVGERMGDNILDWDQIHPYYREQGRTMAENLSQLVEGGDDPIEILSARAKELEIRFWLSCRMNEIHEDDDRFMVLRSQFKDKHPELLHGKQFHPEAVYAPIKGWSYAWDYGQERVRNHFLALFREWLQYDIAGIEMDFCRSPCLFPPGNEISGAPLLTDFVTKLRAAADEKAEQHHRRIQLAVRVPPSLKRCRAAGIEIQKWIQQGLVDVVIPMDRGYFDPEPNLTDFLALVDSQRVAVLGGIEPKVRGYNQSNRQAFAAISSFLYRGADGIYTFNYDCHRMKAKPWKYGGVGPQYTPEEIAFLHHALDTTVLKTHDKQYVVSQDTAYRLADDGGIRPLMSRLPVDASKSFTMTIGDDLKAATEEKRIRSTRLVITFKDEMLSLKPDELNFAVNGQVQGPNNYQFKSSQPDSIEIVLADAPMHRGTNTIQLGLKPGSADDKLIRSIDFNVDYWSPEELRETTTIRANSSGPVMGTQQLFANVPNALDIYIKEPRRVREPSDWPANLLRFQFPESVNAYDPNGQRLWEFSFETSEHTWHIVSKAQEKTMGGIRKNRVMQCEDTIEGATSIRRTVTWSDQQLDLHFSLKNLGKTPLARIQSSMCLQRSAAPDYIDQGNARTFLVSDEGFIASRELVFDPEAKYFYANVGSPLELVDSSTTRHLQEQALFVVSADRRYVLCYAWKGAKSVFMNRATRVRCLHSDLRFTDLAPQQEVEAQGVIFVHEGNLDQAHQRYLEWKG